jgi:hypothetical protein
MGNEVFEHVDWAIKFANKREYNESRFSRG